MWTDGESCLTDFVQTPRKKLRLGPESSRQGSMLGDSSPIYRSTTTGSPSGSRTTLRTPNVALPAPNLHVSFPGTAIEPPLPFMDLPLDVFLEVSTATCLPDSPSTSTPLTTLQVCRHLGPDGLTRLCNVKPYLKLFLHNVEFDNHGAKIGNDIYWQVAREGAGLPACKRFRTELAYAQFLCGRRCQVR